MSSGLLITRYKLRFVPCRRKFWSITRFNHVITTLRLVISLHVRAIFHLEPLPILHLPRSIVTNAIRILLAAACSAAQRRFSLFLWLQFLQHCPTSFGLSGFRRSNSRSGRCPSIALLKNVSAATAQAAGGCCVLLGGCFHAAAPVLAREFPARSLRITMKRPVLQPCACNANAIDIARR